MPSEQQRRGGDQPGLRAYNKRMILNLIRHNGALPKAEIARLTGLSAQAVSVIVNALLKEKLVRKENKVRGKVGQPYTPIALNPEGVLSLGVKIGRRSLELMLVNFLGQAVAYEVFGYPAPRRAKIEATLRREVADLLNGLEPARRARLLGIGVALPGQLSGWTDVLGLDPAELMDWEEADVAALLRDISGLPVEVYNDATAACAAEMVLGGAVTFSSALYIYVGSFIGGGVVINGQLFEGAQGNAGALGSLPVASGKGKAPEQLIRHASLFSLENELETAGLGRGETIAERLRDPKSAPAFAAWRRRAAPAIAQAIAAALSVIDFEGVVIDALLQPPQRAELVAEVAAALQALDLTGTSPLALREGSIGPRARVCGAALLPLIRQFSPDRQLLVKKVAGV